MVKITQTKEVMLLASIPAIAQEILKISIAMNYHPLSTIGMLYSAIPMNEEERLRRAMLERYFIDCCSWERTPFQRPQKKKSLPSR